MFIGVSLKVLEIYFYNFDNYYFERNHLKLKKFFILKASHFRYGFYCTHFGVECTRSTKTRMPATLFSMCASLSPTPHFSAFCIRNINNRDILVTLAILIETTLRAPGVYNEGPAEQTFKFCVGDKKKRCVKFTEGKSESSRDYWKILAKLARLRLKRCRGHWRRGIKYAPPVVIVFAPCLPSVFANFRWNIPQWTRELLAKSSYHDKVLSSQDGFMKIRWSDKHSDQLICGCGCCELFLDRQEFKHHLSIENILWRWKKFMKQKRTWKNIVEEWFQHQNRYAGDVEGAEFADLRVCPFEFLTQNRN